LAESKRAPAGVVEAVAGADAAESRHTRTLVDHLFRHRSGQMVATLARVFGFDRLDAVEDAVQDALVLALRRWPFGGVPDNPNAWLIEVAKNRLLDRLRRASVWERKQAALAAAPPGTSAAVPEESPAAPVRFTSELPDDTLAMMFACCHPSLSPRERVILTLKTVGGFSVGELARALLTGEAGIAQSIVRAKQRLRERVVKLEVPRPGELADRLDSVLEVLYLMFNEGYAASSGDELVRHDVCHEAIRLAELLADHPAAGAPKAQALSALLLFQGARLPARVDAAGELILLEEQDRSLWDGGLLSRGLLRLRRSAAGAALSAYHLEAEIAACHAFAASFVETDWPRIVECYDALLERGASPVAAVNRAVALAHLRGPQAGLAALDELSRASPLDRYYPLHAARGELLQRLGRAVEAAEAYRAALALGPSEPMRRFLAKRLAGLTSS
jgi:RNA polymerase sigma-70 factor (ECF subfamily)